MKYNLLYETFIDLNMFCLGVVLLLALKDWLPVSRTPAKKVTHNAWRIKYGDLLQ